MTPKPTKIGSRMLGGGNDPEITVEPNIDTECFSIRSVNHDDTEDLIHFCDWPAMRATIDQFMEDREAE